MKRIKSKLAVIMMMMLIFTSFEFVGVFAEGEEGAPAETTAVEETLGADEDVVPEEGTDAPAVTEEASDVVEEEADTPAITNAGDDDPEPGVEPEDPEEPVITKTVKSFGYATYSSCNSVVLEWNKAEVKVTTTIGDESTDEYIPEGTDGVTFRYYVKVGNGEYVDVTDKIKEVAATDNNLKAVYNEDGSRKKRWQYTVTGLKPGTGNSSGNKTFTVRAVATYGGEELAPREHSRTDAPVRTIAYQFKVKSSTTLKSHAGPKRSYKLTAGSTLTCDRFGGGGCYMFYYPANAAKPSTFYCAKIRAKNIKAIYTTKWNYSPKEAQFYVNAKGLKSKTGKLLWVNSYTQHIYYFTGPKNTAKKWKYNNGWECATGKAASPSPTGITGVKTILRKVTKHHGIKWWLPYSEWNSVHGQRKGWKFGKPASHGCIRNPIKRMEWLYKQIPVGTTLNVF